MSNQSTKKRKELEHQHQAALIEWANTHAVNQPKLRLLFAIPNGGYRNKASAAKLKAEGVKAGVPDLLLPIPKCRFHGLFIELKTKTGRVTDQQKAWRMLLTEQGYLCVICRSWDSARTLIEQYLDPKSTHRQLEDNAVRTILADMLPSELGPSEDL